MAGRPFDRDAFAAGRSGSCSYMERQDLLGRNRRFHKYIEIMQGRVYCNVKELADKSGRSAKGVVKDLKQMIEKRWFLQGHLDDQETALW